MKYVYKHSITKPLYNNGPLTFRDQREFLAYPETMRRWRSHGDLSSTNGGAWGVIGRRGPSIVVVKICPRQPPAGVAEPFFAPRYSVTSSWKENRNSYRFISNTKTISNWNYYFSGMDPAWYSGGYASSNKAVCTWDVLGSAMCVTTLKYVSAINASYIRRMSDKRKSQTNGITNIQSNLSFNRQNNAWSSLAM